MLNSNEVEAINRHLWISEAAYYKAEAREFEPGKELNDWLEAEMEYSDMQIALYISILEEDGAPITTVSLQQLAAFIGIQNPESLLSELELVRAIQNITQHRPCFRSEINALCGDSDCKWKIECRKLVSVWY